MRTIFYGIIDTTNNKVVSTNCNRAKLEKELETLKEQNPEINYKIGCKWFSI